MGPRLGSWSYLRLGLLCCTLSGAGGGICPAKGLQREGGREGSSDDANHLEV